MLCKEGEGSSLSRCGSGSCCPASLPSNCVKVDVVVHCALSVIAEVNDHSVPNTCSEHWTRNCTIICPVGESCTIFNLCSHFDSFHVNMNSFSYITVDRCWHQERIAGNIVSIYSECSTNFLNNCSGVTTFADNECAFHAAGTVAWNCTVVSECPFIVCDESKGILASFSIQLLSSDVVSFDFNIVDIDFSHG